MRFAAAVAPRLGEVIKKHQNSESTSLIATSQAQQDLGFAPTIWKSVQAGRIG